MITEYEIKLAGVALFGLSLAVSVFTVNPEWMKVSALALIALAVMR